jgi:CheY-like chemotaxis protein
MIKNIWIIDDDDIFQFTAQKYIELKKAAEKTTSFTNGSEAMNHLQQIVHEPDDLPDVILLDINMPILDGWQFIKEFARFEVALKKKVLVYLTTSSIDQADFEKAKGIKNIAGYIVKPLNEEKIINILKQYESTQAQ